MTDPACRYAVGYLHPGEVSAIFTMSLLKVELAEAYRGGLPPYVLAERCSTGQLVEGRNAIAAAFLDTPAEWLLMVDADMGFAPDTIERLEAAADPVDRPIMGALCFATKRQPPDPDIHAERFLSCPTIYTFEERDNEAGFQVVTNYPRDQVVQVAATGAACVLVHRSVFEAIRDKYGPTWFDQATHPTGRRFSEDMSFFVRAQACDIPVHVHTGVKTAHDKGLLHLTEETWDAQQARLDDRTVELPAGFELEGAR